MTLTSEINRVQYSGTGAQTVFPITFVFWLDADIQAIHTDASGSETIWVEGVQFTLTGGSGSTGTLTVKTSPTDYTPASGETLTITSSLEDTQDTSLPEGGAFPSSSVEQQLDKIVRLIQQKAEALGRAIKLPVSSANTDLEIPDPSASKFLRWNSGATALENADISAAGAIGVPVTVAEGGTGATTAAAARTALGVQADLDVPSQAEAEAGTSTSERVWTAQRVGQAVAALAAGKQTIWIPAGAMRPTVSNGCDFITSVETTAGRPDMQVMAFDPTTEEAAQFSVRFPKSWNEGPITFQALWTVNSAVTTGVAIGLQGVAVSDNETIDVTYGTAVVVADDALNAAKDLSVTAESAAVTIAGTPTSGDLVFFRITRDVADANDDMAQDMWLLGLAVFFTTDDVDDS